MLKASSKVLAINFMSVFPLLNTPWEYSAYMSSVSAVLLAVHFNELFETFLTLTLFNLSSKYTCIRSLAIILATL